MNALMNTIFKKRSFDPPKRPSTLVGPRIPRPSSSWSAMLTHLRSEGGLRLLDVGPMSTSNVNTLTSMGHSICMADIVSEAHRERWRTLEGEDANDGDVEMFLEQTMEFSGRKFDVVLLWSTLDYLPEALLKPVIDKLHQSVEPGGKILAFFHPPIGGSDETYYRYHITENAAVEMQAAETFALRRVSSNRKIEKTFAAFRGCSFFLGKDNVYEVIVTR
jgi:phospholipid N-methyltransferase